MKRVTAGALEPGMVLAQDTFAKGSTHAVLRAATKLGERGIERLQALGIRDVLIAEAPEEVGMKPGEAARMLEQAVHHVEAPAPVITEELREEALETLENLFDAAEGGEGFFQSPEAGHQVETVVDELVDSLAGSGDTLVNIHDLKSYDDYTYHHSLSVAVMSIGLAQRLGLSEREVHRLGLCALMHDIGKTAVPVDIIRKPSRLTDDEFRLVKGHSAAGWDYLSQSAIGDEEIWEGVRHHHEKVDGTGYPFGLKGNDIPLWSRIISAADVFDALTSNRPYRTPMQPSEALEYLMGGIGTSFDYDIVKALKERADLYPRGSVVELSNGTYALVLDCENQLRPVVEMLGSGQVVDLDNDRSALSLVVKRLVPAAELKTAAVVF